MMGESDEKPLSMVRDAVAKFDNAAILMPGSFHKRSKVSGELRYVVHSASEADPGQRVSRRERKYCKRIGSSIPHFQYGKELNMDELVKSVADRVGISEDQAKKAVDVIVGFLKQRLPGSVSGQLDSLIAGGSTGSATADAAKGLGSKLGL